MRSGFQTVPDRKKIIILLSFLLLFPAFPTWAGVEDVAVKGFTGILNNISTGIASWMFKYLQMFVLNPTDLSKLGQNINFYIGYTQALGISLVIYFAVQRLFINFIKTGLGEQTEEPAKIIGRAIIGGVMVVSVHYILDIMIQINNAIIHDISNIGIAASQFKNVFTVSADAIKAAGDMAILFLILVIASLILAIMGGIRYAEIAFMYIIAPVLMSGENATSLMGSFFRTAIGIIYTQAVQLTIIGLLMSAITNQAGPDQLFISIGIIVLLLRGPKLLREYLYSSGTGSGMMNAAGQAMSYSRRGALRSLGSQAMSTIPLPMPGMAGGAMSRGGPATSPRSGSYTSRR